jgi:8-oxo-dGTP diphosphatase
MPFDESVTVVIFNAQKSAVLLVKRRDIPVWVLPGGGIDPGESPEKAAVREAEEETGYQVQIARKVAEYLPVNRFSRVTHVFECAILQGTPTLSSETSAVDFFPLTDLPKYLSPPYRDWIREAKENVPELIRKKIAGVSYWHLIKYLFLHPLLVCRFLLLKFK